MRLRPSFLIPFVIPPLVLMACASSGTPEPSGSGSNPASTAGPGVGELVPNSTPRGDAAFIGPVRRVEANGIQIGYRQVGSGRPLVLIMGFDGSMSLWQHELVRALVDAGFQVTMFDNRGVGYSTDDPSRPLTIPLMAADTAALTRRLGLANPVLVGWSMGGEIALTLAGAEPGLPGAVVTSGGDAGSKHYTPPTPAALRALENPSDEALMRLIFPAGQESASKAFVESIELYPSESVPAPTLKRQLEAEDAFAKYAGTWDRLPSIKAPTVIQNGTLDEITVPVNARRLAGRIQGSKLVFFPDAAHGSLFQDIPRFARLVRESAGLP